MKNITYLLVLFFYCCSSPNNNSTDVDSISKVSIEPEIEKKVSLKDPKENIPPEEIKVEIDFSKIEIPKELSFSKLIPSDFCQTKFQCIQNKFFPLGWSKKGTFAFINERPPQAAGTIFTLTIMDMNEDKVLYENRWVEEFEDVTGLWKEHHVLIIEKLNEYGVQYISPIIQLQKLPYTKKGQQFKVLLEEDQNDDGLIIRQKLFCKASSLGTKKVYDKKNRKKLKGDYGLNQSTIIGALINPYENRMAILKLNESAGWEGDEELSIELIGCDLKTNFTNRYQDKY